MNASKILNFVLLIVIILMLVWNGVNTRNNKTEVAASAVENTDTVRHSSGEFVKIDINNLNESAVKLFAKDWFVLTAGDGETFNPMTISWGGLGELWNEPVVTVYVRHNRYTYQYINGNKMFTICTFDEEYREAMQYIGTYSGRDGDKIKATGLTATKTELGSLYYQEARLVIECEKVYSDDLDMRFIQDTEYAKLYKGDETNPHRMFIGKIVNVWVKQ